MIREITVAQRGRDPLNGIQHTMESCVELLQVLEGRGHFLMGGELFPLRRGAVLLIDSDCLHCSAPEEDAEYVRNKVILDRASFLSLSELAASDWKQGRFYLLGETETEEVSRLIGTLTCGDSHQGWENLATVARIMELCARADESRTAQTAPTDPILDYINRHLDQPLSLDLLARETHFSKYYLCDLFRRKTGMTPMRYIRLLRISRAQRLLLTTSDSVSNVGLACGFDNFSFFCRAFRSVSGMSPTEYRKRRGGEDWNFEKSEQEDA